MPIILEHRGSQGLFSSSSLSVYSMVASYFKYFLLQGA